METYLGTKKGRLSICVKGSWTYQCSQSNYQKEQNG